MSTFATTAWVPILRDTTTTTDYQYNDYRYTDYQPKPYTTNWDRPIWDNPSDWNKWNQPQPGTWQRSPWWDNPTRIDDDPQRLISDWEEICRILEIGNEPKTRQQELRDKFNGGKPLKMDFI
jgi:hypothetical protein